MRRREVLRGAAGVTATGTFSLAGVDRVAGHPGPYRPYGSVDVEGATEAVVGDDGTTVYVAATTGFAVVDTSAPSDPRVVAERRRILSDRQNGPLRRIHDVKVEGDTLLVVGPADPMGEDVLQGAAIYDVSDPANPERTGFHATDYPIHNCFVRDGVAYLTGNDGERNPLVLVDVSGDQPQELGRWSVVDANAAWGDVAPWLRTCHDVWVQDGTAYVANWDAGTWLVDVSDPSAPSTIAGFGDYQPADLASLSDGDAQRAEGFQLPGNSHYASVNDDASVLAVGEEAWDLDASDGRDGGERTTSSRSSSGRRSDGGPGGITLYDLADPTDPSELARISAPYTPEAGIGGIWTTSHNFDLVGDRLFTSWYQGGVKTFDVSDPANPVELSWWRDPERTSFWTAQRATGCFVASCRDIPESEIDGALYTFPTHPGTQEDVPSIPLTPAPNGTGNRTTTSSITTTTATTTNSTTTPPAGAADTVSDGQAGFGVAAALLGGALAAWRRARDG